MTDKELQQERQRIGAALRELRKEHKLTLKQLGEMSGLGYSYIGKIEKGLYNYHIDQLVKIVAAIDADFLKKMLFFLAKYFAKSK